jgi:hypothetical protein
MKKIKAASLVVTLVAFLSLMSAAMPAFNHFFVDPAKVGFCSTIPAAQVGFCSTIPPAKVGYCNAGLAAYFAALAKAGTLGISAF